MNNRNGKTIVNRGGAEVGKTKVAKEVRAAFLGSYNYFQPGRANQYDLGTDNFNGLTDIPLYLAWMNEKNGGILYFPTNLKEKYQFYRYFYRSDAYVGAAIDLHTDLPMSKITLKMPPMNNIKRRNIIKKKYESMCEKLKLFTKLQSILFDYWVIGNVFVFCQYDPNLKEFVKLVILPPEDVNITKYPLSDDSLIVYNQEQVIELVKRLKSLNKDYNNFDLYLNNITTASELSEVDKRILNSIPEELLKYIFENESINFDTDPYAGGELGSFCFHLARRKHEYATLGSSILERIFVPLMQKLHYTYTQWSLASRNMTPRNKITAPEISPEQLEQLREQFDMSMLTPEYSIITNYDWNWDIVGADNRLIDLGREYEVIENQIFAGLGVTREVLTGEGMYSSGHINVEIMNARYLLIRDIFKNMVEENLFKPIAKENGFFDIDEDGFTHYYYPRLSFERLSIIDNSENFDKMFNLYQKGSLPIGYIYELLNIDEEEANEKLKKDMFTVKDATFNEMTREVYTRLGDSIVDESNIAQLVAGSLYVNGVSVKMKSSEENEEDGMESEDSSVSEDPFSTESEEQNNNSDVDNVDNKDKIKEKEIEKHSVELNNQDFEDFIKTQELVATDDEITEFLKKQNEVMIYNKDLKEFMNEYFLKPTNKDVDTFENLIDPEFHPTNVMFENFLEKRGIVSPNNKDVKDFFKLYFLKPTNEQIRKFLDRYQYISIENEDIEEFIEKSKEDKIEDIKESQENDNNIDIMTATNDDLEKYLEDQTGDDVTNNIIVNNKKSKKAFKI